MTTSGTEKIGEISSEKANITWKIKNFSSHTKGNPKYPKYRSPEFLVLNSAWQITILPNGSASDKSTGHVSLYLHRIDSGTSKPVDFEFGIRTRNYLIANKMRAKKWNSNKKGWGFHKFIAISELQQKKNLIPFGNLTIICTLTEKGEDDFDVDASKNKLVADFKHMFISKKDTDVTIKVQEETFSAHRFILTARSPVLTAMFENDMAEKKTGFIDISDCDPKAFKQFLLYLYSGELDSENCDFFHLYKIADKYDVPQLKLMCLDLIIDNTSLENFCEVYVFGDQFNEKKILTKIQKFFEESFEEVVFSDSWELFLKENTCLANNLLKAMACKIKIEKYHL